jgi:hypothetical protein
MRGHCRRLGAGVNEHFVEAMVLLSQLRRAGWWN